VVDGQGAAGELAVGGRRLVWTVFLACVGAEIAVFLLDYHVSYGRLVTVGAIRRLCNNAREDGLGSWLAVTQTSLVALTAWLLAALARGGAAGAGGLRAWRARGWVTLAAFLTYLALDDGAKVHERLGTTAAELWGDGGNVLLAAFPSYAWQLVVGPPLALLGAFTLVFLWRQLRDGHGRLLVVAALACLVLAVGLDFLEGLAREHPWNVWGRAARGIALNRWTQLRFEESAYDTLVHFSKSLEECLEMLGMTLLWCALLRHLAAHGEIRVRFGAAPSA